MSGSSYDEAQKLKKNLKKWEADFIAEHDRKPKKEDIDAAPQNIQDTYKDYNKLKRQIQERLDKKTSSKSSEKDHSEEKYDQNQNSSHHSSPGSKERKRSSDKSFEEEKQTDENSLENVPDVWSREFDKKKNEINKTTGRTDSTGKKSNQRSEPVVVRKELRNKDDKEKKTDIYNHHITEENFKIKNDLFEKAASLANKKQISSDYDSEQVIIHDKFKVKPKANLSQFSKSFCDNESNESGNTGKIEKSYDQAWDEVDHMTPFADESNTYSSKGFSEDPVSFDKSPKKIVSGRKFSMKNEQSSDSNFKHDHFVSDHEEPMDVDDQSYSANVSRVKKPVSRRTKKSIPENSENEEMNKEDTMQISSNMFNFNETDDVPIIPKHGKRKAENSTDGPSKKRKIKLVEEEKVNVDSVEGADDDEKPKAKKSYAPARNKAAASSTSSENFVRLNMKIKTYKRKGKKGMTGPQMRRFQWKQKMKSRSKSYGDKCFKCGQEGHWANKCTGQGKAKEEIDDKPPVLDENFPTLKQASMMAKGIKMDVQEKKIKEKRKSKETDDSTEEKEEDDFDDLDVEAGVVRNTREQPDTPPPMEPFFTMEESRSQDIPESVRKGLKMFGYERFRHGQEKAVLRILSGSSTMVILSTGGGKSLTYQLPAVLYAEKSTCFTLVISPLVSLMEDQITGLPPGVKGACLHTNMTKAQRESVMDSVKEGKVHFLLVSPEAIAGGTMSALTSAANLPPISFVCIDEAHCLSEWSHNFRPSYLRLTKVLRERFGVKCFLGLTATATLSTAADVAKHLGIDNIEEAIVRGPPVPKNLFLSVSRDENRDEALIGLLQGDRFSQCESIILYCTRRDTTERLATLIRTSLQDQKGENWTGDRTKRKGGKKQYNYWDAESYHAGLSAAARKRVQNAFMSGRLRVVVATVAFGMGLDKSNVRGVIHYNMPKSFESYVQEIGRAGRDGKPSHCHVFLDSEGKDLSELRRHTFSNTVDYRTLKKFVLKVFTPCKCREVHSRHKQALKESTSDDATLAETEELFDEWDGEDKETKRLCSGHERAIHIDNLVMDLDVKEEGISTLFCYLELHPHETWKLENLTNVYSTCNIQCYGGPALLQEIAKKCPPVAVAIAKAKKDGINFAGKTHIDFPVVEISDCMGWDSGPVKRELKMLMWNLTGANGPSRTGVMVEFANLAFHYRAPGDLTEDEIDDVIMSLHTRIQKQEKAELTNLKYLFDTLHSVSHKNFWMCADDLDEKKNDKLKIILEDYFQEQTDFKAAVLDATEPELSSYELNQVSSDIKQFINMYSQEHKLNGRAIARVFHGIASPCFPATTWGRVRRFWRSNINVDFNLLIKLATKLLIQMR
ncbi:RECQL4 [Mytilus coruscus]|uniref:ATP-dependent DNA helicase Q4 n=1 Tax=Mytilus coruscus TaxID=42192 RepID=A0A6J7ZXF8_MYTCO|nr:RECQL4 [Mytilus coruscus]